MEDPVPKQNNPNQWKKAQKYIEKQVTQKVEEQVPQRVEEQVAQQVEGVQQKISEQIKDELKGELDKQVNTKLKKEVGKQVSRRLEKFLEDGLFKTQQGIQANRFLYGFLVGIGFLLFWYGTWQIIPLIPILNQGFVAFIVGLFLLVISGALYYKIVGPSSKEKQ